MMSPFLESLKLNPLTSTLTPTSSKVSNASALTSGATNKTSNPLPNLLSSLVAKGLLFAETGTPAEVPSEAITRLEDHCDNFSASSSMPAVVWFCSWPGSFDQR
ncbi:hypothetical protein KIW84_035381 [Lathyrus oleraceus]|uniref:Uncharacterized protein n=1 Tax=Pisum sativum TaxID=3888 RepID=A0A9D5B0N5_PEA|nr:hypothetical protein KIW84_035381 [Pisum sativum]